MNNHFEKYMLHPIERPITDADAKVDLIRSKDHPVMDFFYESAFYRHPYEICREEYALPYEELFCFAGTNNETEKLGAVVHFVIAGREIVTDRNCMILVPAYVPHGPISIADMESPVFSYCAGAGREHVGLPRSSWKTDDIPALEDMIIYYNGDAEDPDRKPTLDQYILLKCLAGKTMKGDMFSILRRYNQTDGWAFASGHLHDNPEILCYYGGDPWHPYELSGTYTQFIGGERHIITRPTVCYFPPYVIHCPLTIDKVEKQDLWHSLSPKLGAYNRRDLEGMAIGCGEIDMKEPW